MWTRSIVLATLCAVAWWAWNTFGSISRPEGVLAPSEPVQAELPPDRADAWTFLGWRVTPLATYDIEARVLSRKLYRNDTFAELCRLDLALGWGRMSDTAVLEKLSVWQEGRFFWWRTRDGCPLPPEELITHAANTHIVPGTIEAQEALRRVRVGNIVRLRGRLIEAAKQGKATFRSSLRRNDTGKGACEILWVESVEVR